jgi:hypothetical protein
LSWLLHPSQMDFQKAYPRRQHNAR